MCIVTELRRLATAPLAYFEVTFEGDETPYRVWADTKQHAEEAARGVANYLDWVEDPLKSHQLPK